MENYQKFIVNAKLICQEYIGLSLIVNPNSLKDSDSTNYELDIPIKVQELLVQLYLGNCKIFGVR